jgi:hypothetical protein
MSGVPDNVGGYDGGLGALQVLLSGAADSFQTVRLTCRVWRHEQRLREAFHAHVEAQQRRGGVFFAAAPPGGEPGPAETKETIRIWRAGQLVRQEHHGGWPDGAYGVINGPQWWSWSEQMGAISGHGDTNFGGNVDRGFEVMLNPAPLLSWLELAVAGNSRVAGRSTLTAHAATRSEGLRGVKVPSDWRMFRALGALGVGADSYRLEVDRERGVLLAVSAIRDGQPFSEIATLAIGFDEPIAAETFEFKPPHGEPIRSLRDAYADRAGPGGVFPRPEFVSVTEAQRRASFTVLTPDHLPTGWLQQPFCGYRETPSGSSAVVHLHYRTNTGNQRVMIVQMTAADAPQHYGMILGVDNWHEVLSEGTLIKIQPTAQRLYAQAHLTRHGTFAYLESEGLTTEELTTIAASLRPAPETGGI